MKFKLINNGKCIYFRSLSGGKPVIGRGAYGIVLKPDIKYGNDTYISKLFILPDNITIKEFIEFEMKLNSKDIDNKYHVPIIDIEMINESHSLKELDDKDINKYVYIATYEYGGISLDNLLNYQKYNSYFTINFCIDILNGFLNLYDGIMFFFQYDINHNDIHLGNIVISLDNPSIMRFIDFNPKSPFSSINMNYIQDIIDLLHSIQRIMNKSSEFLMPKYKDYFQSMHIFIDKSIETLFHGDDDISHIPIIKQLLVEKISELKV